MLKKSIIATMWLVLLVSYPGQAQVLKFGPCVSGSTSWVDLSEEKFQIDRQWGYQIGLVTRFDFFLAYLQSEILFIHLGAQYQRPTEGTTDKHDLQVTRVDMPIMLGTSLLGSLLRVQAGPVLSVLIHAEEDHTQVDDQYKRFIVGYQVGLGADIGKLLIDLKYEGDISKLGNQLAGIQVDQRAQQLVASLGYSFL